MAEKREEEFLRERQLMVENQIVARGIKDKNVIKAMLEVPRHLFVPDSLVDQAYGDFPLPIGEGQTISQPYIVALMTELLKLDRESVVLEIGTGSGYHAAVISRIAKKVYSVEIIPELAERAKRVLKLLGYNNVEVVVKDGSDGLPDKSPFDAVLLTAAPPAVPEVLIDQLKIGGRLVAPVGEFFQELLVIEKKKDGIEKRSVAAVRFVPMMGKVRKNH